MKIKFFKFFKLVVFLSPLLVLSNCSDFRKAVGKEKVIPDEFSIAVTPSLLIPPGYKIDPQVLNKSDLKETDNDFNLKKEIDIKEKKEMSSFSHLFSSKNIPKNIS